MKESLQVCVRVRERERKRDGSNMRRLVKLSEVVASAKRKNDSREQSRTNKRMNSYYTSE